VVGQQAAVELPEHRWHVFPSLPVISYQ